jgi:hypothetical protein
MSDLNLSELQPWIALLFGILILAIPRVLNILVAAYLILIGLSGLLARHGTDLGL